MTTEFGGGEDSRNIVGRGIYEDPGARGAFGGLRSKQTYLVSKRELEDMSESKIVKKTKIAVCHLLPFKILCTEHQAYFLSYIHLLLAQCKTEVDICLPNWQWGTEAHVWVR